MNGDGSGKWGAPHERAWMHRQNIRRYRSLLADPANGDRHDQIRKLLHEEEEKLRALGAGD